MPDRQPGRRKRRSGVLALNSGSSSQGRGGIFRMNQPGGSFMAGRPAGGGAGAAATGGAGALMEALLGPRGGAPSVEGSPEIGPPIAPPGPPLGIDPSPGPHLPDFQPPVFEGQPPGPGPGGMQGRLPIFMPPPIPQPPDPRLRRYGG